MSICSSRFFILRLDVFVDLLLNEVSEVGGPSEFLDVELEQLRQNLNAQRPMGWVITAFVNVTSDDGRRHSVICKDKVNPAFLGSIIGVAGSLSRFALASQTVVPDVCPSFLVDERHCSR